MRILAKDMVQRQIVLIGHLLGKSFIAKNPILGLCLGTWLMLQGNKEIENKDTALNAERGPVDICPSLGSSSACSHGVKGQSFKADLQKDCFSL